ncbi:DMT family transporter [Breoghania sp.]|uniref:DMT family transporter n=1 Tax=Breoghania sp. TaxID=2065378 RepID=UPI002610F274|nr:DMT family transporter [Breoghania sp.]MDJ0931936.1 DMT family transporter [Breoghania sp.]
MTMQPDVPSSSQMSPATWAMLIFLSILWGGSFFFTKVAVAEIAPMEIVLLRVLIAAIVLHAVLRLKGPAFPTTLSTFTPFLIMGLLNNAVPFGLLTWGQTELASGLAAILNAFTPISTVIILHLFTQTDRATPLKVAGVILGFCGVAVMIGAEAIAGVGDHVVAELACLGATVSYGFSALYGRRFRNTPALVTATGQLTGSSLILLVMVLVTGGAGFVDNWPSTPVIASMLGLALLSTALAYILFFRILSQAGPANVMLVTFLVPVSAILAGALVLGEVLEPRHWAGMALIAAALVTIDGRIPRLLLRRSRPGRERI